MVLVPRANRIGATPELMRESRASVISRTGSASAPMPRADVGGDYRRAMAVQAQERLFRHNTRRRIDLE